MGQSIRKIVEDASLRESRNRINAFHAQQAAAVSKGRNCSAYLELKPRFIRKDGITPTFRLSSFAVLSLIVDNFLRFHLRRVGTTAVLL